MSNESSPAATQAAGSQQSPQERGRCCCPAWSTAKECIRHRYDGLVESDEECECSCHCEYEDDE